jgi:hypothetical protein
VLIAEDGEVGEVPQGIVVLGDATMRLEVGRSRLALGRSSRLRKAVSTSSLRWLLTATLLGSRTGTHGDNGGARSWLQLVV